MHFVHCAHPTPRLHPMQLLQSCVPTPALAPCAACFSSFSSQTSSAQSPGHPFRRSIVICCRSLSLLLRCSTEERDCKDLINRLHQLVPPRTDATRYEVLALHWHSFTIRNTLSRAPCRPFRTSSFKTVPSPLLKPSQPHSSLPPQKPAGPALVSI